MSQYYDDPIITSQGTFILEENVDDYIRQIEREEVGQLSERKKETIMKSKYYDDPIITSQETIILEENVDDYIRQIEREEVEQLADKSKKIEKKQVLILSPIEEVAEGKVNVNIITPK
jgi:uncharacterized protein (UPF0335 family)